MYKILILVGSGSPNSHTLNLAKSVSKNFQKLGIHVDILDLGGFDLPQFNTESKEKTQNNLKIAEFINLTKQADGYIWASPVYHGSFSGILKNALDRQPSLDKKIVGLVSNGMNRSSIVVDQLTLIARSQHAIAIPTRICSQESDFDKQKNITNQDISSRIEAFCTEFIWYLGKFTS